LFERPHHRRIATILLALDGDLLAAQGCLFAGGTAIVLRHGEYRESVDIDFLVSRPEGYRTLRLWLLGPLGLGSITRPGVSLPRWDPIRADQYGLRTALHIEQMPVKFEIVRESRIDLESPAEADVVCGVRTLTMLDMVTSKLLANSDRWADSGVMSRDLIDLAMMRPGRRLMQRAVMKARTAYGDSVEADLKKAIALLRDNPGRLERCMNAMGMTTVAPALLWSRIKALAPR
jgi:hypothetical protein